MARAERRDKGHHLSDELVKPIDRSGLFDAGAYLRTHEDVRKTGADPWIHFCNYGISEGRQFTSLESVAKVLSRCEDKIQEAGLEFRKLATGGSDHVIDKAAKAFKSRGAVIGIFYSSKGTCATRQIADLVNWQMEALGIQSRMRDEESDPTEVFEIRIFIGPHEFFSIGRGRVWERFANAPGSVLFNIEQIQTPGFAGALALLLRAPLVIDINFHTAVLLRQIGCNAIHYTPPYLHGCTYTSPQLDISNMDIVRGYHFSREPFDWTISRELSNRPIDVLFIYSTEREIKAIDILRGLTDRFRFICIRGEDASFEVRKSQETRAEWMLAQRSKIILNINSDWIGSFDWHKTVMRGLWQGACVVSDPGLPSPAFAPGSHYIEEALRHLPELLYWLLDTFDGRLKMNEIAAAGHRQATGAGSSALLLPMLHSLRELVNE